MKLKLEFEQHRNHMLNMKLLDKNKRIKKYIEFKKR